MLEFTQTKGIKYEIKKRFVIYLPAVLSCPGGEIKKPIYQFPKGRYQKYIDGVRLTRNTITLEKGFTHDGSSGPTWDTKSTQIGAAVHDAFYVWISKAFDHETQKKEIENWRSYADALLYVILRTRPHKMNWFRARAWYRAVRLFGSGCVKDVSENEIKLKLKWRFNK